MQFEKGQCLCGDENDIGDTVFTFVEFGSKLHSHVENNMQIITSFITATLVAQACQPLKGLGFLPKLLVQRHSWLLSQLS